MSDKEYCVATNSVMDLGISDLVLIEPDSWYPEDGYMGIPKNIQSVKPTLYSREEAEKIAQRFEDAQSQKIRDNGGEKQTRIFAKKWRV